MTVSLADIEAAHARIEAHIHRTPVLSSRLLNERAQCEVSFKCENLQRVGAFKARGALNAVLGLADDVAAVATHSSGNHGAALAMAAGVRSRCSSTVSCSTTGIAGPGGGTPDKPVGLVWIGIATPRRIQARRYLFSGDRLSVRQQTVDACFELLLEQIQS